MEYVWAHSQKAAREMQIAAQLTASHIEYIGFEKSETHPIHEQVAEQVYAVWKSLTDHFHNHASN